MLAACLLLARCSLIAATCSGHWPLGTGHSPLATCHLPLTTYHLPLTTHHLLLTTARSLIAGGAAAGQWGVPRPCFAAAGLHPPFVSPLHQACHLCPIQRAPLHLAPLYERSHPDRSRLAPRTRAAVLCFGGGADWAGASSLLMSGEAFALRPLLWPLPSFAEGEGGSSRWV